MNRNYIIAICIAIVAAGWLVGLSNNCHSLLDKGYMYYDGSNICKTIFPIQY